MSDIGSKKDRQSSERRVGLLVGAAFLIGLLYVASSYARFHKAEHGELRYGQGRADLCGDIKAKRPAMHTTLAADKIC
jgi:hypothetical protein